MTNVKISDIELLKPRYYYLDFDCTLVKSLDESVKLLNSIHNKNLKPEDIKTWNFKEYDADLTDEQIEKIFADERFFDELQFYEGAKEFLFRHKNNTIIVTKGTDKNLYLKKQWLKKQGIEIPIIGLPVELSKSFINMGENTVFIDDSTYNLVDSNASWKIQFREFDETYWNKDWKGWVFKSWI